MTSHEIARRIRDEAQAAGFSLDAEQERLVDVLAGSDGSVYVHGPVGRGKSWIVDALFRAAAGAADRRLHFHAFLDELHRAVFRRQTALRAERLAADMRQARTPSDAKPVVLTTGRPDPETGEGVDALAAAPPDRPDPVAQALDDVTGDARLLVFDEFHVHDPGDARLLTRLVEHAIDRGIRIVATSNDAAEDLLPDPVWHHLMEPGIRLIRSHFREVRLDGGVDYRRPTGGAGFAGGRWTPEAPGPAPDGARSVDVRDRSFSVTAATDDELWVTFDELCVAATSAIEFLDWARRFPAWTVLDVPLFDDVPLSAQQRFLTVVDVLVDADVPTTFVSAAPLDAFCAAATARPDAARLVSRLNLLAR
ncbi:cell division protein ZapE [Microbacterium sp. gxy059]|uniref:cell division protein ZapE n=1 Tax=Microbacterium sp. gxy059 TaxID=2957199 RepID=UPI003D996B4B